MPPSKNSSDPQEDNEYSYQDTILNVFKNKFGSWVHTYHHDPISNRIRLVSRDKKRVHVLQEHEFPSEYEGY